jgi:hypothetical protein
MFSLCLKPKATGAARKILFTIIICILEAGDGWLDDFSAGAFESVLMRFSKVIGGEIYGGK